MNTKRTLYLVLIVGLLLLILASLDYIKTFTRTNDVPESTEQQTRKYEGENIPGNMPFASHFDAWKNDGNLVVDFEVAPSEEIVSEGLVAYAELYTQASYETIGTNPYSEAVPYSPQIVTLWIHDDTKSADSRIQDIVQQIQQDNVDYPELKQKLSVGEIKIGSSTWKYADFPDHFDGGYHRNFYLDKDGYVLSFSIPNEQIDLPEYADKTLWRLKAIELLNL